MDSRPSSRFAVRRSLLLSLLAHTVALVVMTMLLQPAGSGANAPLALQVSSLEPAPEFETLVMSDALLPPEAGDLLSDDEKDLFGSSGLEADAAAADGRPGNGIVGSGADVASHRGSGPGASFFGTVAYGDAFVYVVDISTSMDRGQGPSASEGTRFMRAMAELKASIDRLSPAQSFYVILFCGQTRRMFDDAEIFPKAISATPQNKRRLNEWLATVATGDSTDPREALSVGLGMRPSALFLLSDGEFNGQQTNNNAGLLKGNPSVFQIVDRHNRGGTPIHTIAYEDTANCRTMERLSKSTGGNYRFIPPHAALAATSTHPVDLAKNRANYLLSQAKALELRGRAKQAQAVYRRIEREFSATDAAQAAAAKVSESSTSNP